MAAALTKNTASPRTATVPLRRWSARALACLIPAVVVYALTPQVGFLHDGQRYSEIASHPFSNHVGSPWSLRIGVPLLVHISPLSQKESFYGLAFLALLVAGLFVAATVAELGLPESHVRAAAVLTCASELTVISFWAYYVDVEMLAVYAALIYFAVRRRSWLLLPLVAGGMLVKEIAVLGAPLAALIWGRGRRTTLIAGVAALAAIAVFFAETRLLPTKGVRSGISPTITKGSVLHTQWEFTKTWLHQIQRIGVVKYAGNAVLSVFGLAWLAWPAGLRRAPAWLRRSQWWILLALPLFITAQWERSFAYFLPLVIPVAMLGLRAWRPLELALLTIASAWVSAVAPAETVGDDRLTSATTKLAWMSPGFALGGAAVIVLVLRRRAGIAGPTAAAPG